MNSAAVHLLLSLLPTISQNWKDCATISESCTGAGFFSPEKSQHLNMESTNFSASFLRMNENFFSTHSPSSATNSVEMCIRDRYLICSYRLSLSADQKLHHLPCRNALWHMDTLPDCTPPLRRNRFSLSPST